jgi:hypothetical protein
MSRWVTGWAASCQRQATAQSASQPTARLTAKRGPVGFVAAAAAPHLTVIAANHPTKIRPRPSTTALRSDAITPPPPEHENDAHTRRQPRARNVGGGRTFRSPTRQEGGSVAVFDLEA